MRHLARNIATRVIVAVVVAIILTLIGVRKAHAQQCPPGKSPVALRVISASNTYEVANPPVGTLTDAATMASLLKLHRVYYPPGQVANPNLSSRVWCDPKGTSDQSTFSSRSDAANAGCTGNFGGTAAISAVVECGVRVQKCNQMAGTIISLTGQGAAPSQTCIDNCNYQDVVTIGIPGQDWGGSYQTDGQYCEPPPEGPQGVATTTEACQVVQGNNVCTGGQIPKECVRINGQLSCTNSGGGVCTTPECKVLATAVRNADGSSTAMRDAPSPSAPNTGVPGEKAPSSFDYTQTTRTGAGQGNGTGSVTNSYSYYSASTVNNSYNGDGSVGNQTKPATNKDPQENGNCGRTGQPACQEQEDKKACGGVGQPACTVKIDESGTPQQGKDLEEPDLEKGRADASAVKSGVEDWKLPSLEIFQAQACQSLTLEAPQNLANALHLDFGGAQMQLPGPQFCPLIDQIKSVAGWGMAIFVFFAAVFAVARASASTSSTKMASIND